MDMSNNANDEIHVTEHVVVKKSGPIGRLVARMQERPIATSLGLGAAGAAVAVGGYNLSRHGTLLPPGQGDGFVGGMASAAFASFFG